MRVQHAVADSAKKPSSLARRAMDLREAQIIRIDVFTPLFATVSLTAACCCAMSGTIDDGSLVSVKVRELLALIESDGWVLVRTKGSHRQFQHPTKPGTVTVAGNLGVDVPAGTLNSVLKQAGLKK
jgi:predicted RNA binding protein YcfA (HicA-like mRNA interferase family)